MTRDSRKLLATALICGVFTGFWTTTGVDPDPTNLLFQVLSILAAQVDLPTLKFMAWVLPLIFSVTAAGLLIIWLLTSGLQAKAVAGLGFASGFLFAVNPVASWTPYLGVVFLFVGVLLSA